MAFFQNNNGKIKKIFILIDKQENLETSISKRNWHILSTLSIAIDTVKWYNVL